MQWDERDWEYRAEGGKHLVVVNLSIRKILRFIKVPVGVERNLDDERIQIERRLNYEKYAPLLSEFEIQTDSGELVFLSADFCDPLFARIDDDRPNARKLLEVPRGPRYAVLQDDFSQNNSNETSFAIEIKPKCSHVQPNLRSCQFCLMQLEHLLDGRDVNSRCFYCSADFFSSDLNRKKFAFKNLLENPLKDLRFFNDGELIFSMDTLEYVGRTGNDRFHKKMDELCGFEDALEKIIDDLCNALGSSENDEKCLASTFKNKHSTHTAISSPFGPLRAISALQKTSTHTATEAFESYGRLSKEDRQKLTNPSEDWINSANKTENLTDIDIARRHLISKTFKDCSLMIIFTPKENVETKFHFEIIDLDLKPTKKFLEHKEKEDGLLKLQEDETLGN